MNWFRENRFLGTFALVFGVAVLAAVVFLFSAKADWDAATARFTNVSTELSRLQRLAPYPNAENLRKMKAHAEDYAAALKKSKADLANRGAPAEKIQPSEFQSRLRVTINGVAEKARANKVKLPDKFYLGFDEYAAALPASDETSALLGQELLQMEWLAGALLDARIDALTALRRTPLPEEHGEGPKPGLVAPGKAPERNVVELTFVSTPAAARRVINQIAGANREFCIIRLLHVRNEKAAGPPREASDTAASSAPAPSTNTKSTPAALNFIVGNEKIETTAKIEILRFAF